MLLTRVYLPSLYLVPPRIEWTDGWVLLFFVRLLVFQYNCRTSTSVNSIATISLKVDPC
jgi:hypothetical protein